MAIFQAVTCQHGIHDTHGSRIGVVVLDAQITIRMRRWLIVHQVIVRRQIEVVGVGMKRPIFSVRALKGRHENLPRQSVKLLSPDLNIVMDLVGSDKQRPLSRFHFEVLGQEVLSGRTTEWPEESVIFFANEQMIDTPRRSFCHNSGPSPAQCGQSHPSASRLLEERPSNRRVQSCQDGAAAAAQSGDAPGIAVPRVDRFVRKYASLLHLSQAIIISVDY